MKSANQKENWKHGCFFFSYSTQFWRLDTSDRQQSLVQGDAPLGAIISWGGSDSIAQFKDLYFHRVFHRGDIASTEQLEPSTTRFLSRSMDLHPKINFSEIESYVLFFSSRSCLQRWKIFLLKALQWELKTFQRWWGLLMHSWYTRPYWREQYLLKGITNISHIHMQTAAQESKQRGQSSTARFSFLVPADVLWLGISITSLVFSLARTCLQFPLVANDITSITNMEGTVERHSTKVY